MSPQRVLLFLVGFLLYLSFSPILIFLALPLAYFTFIDLSTNTILEAIARLGSRLGSWIPMLENAHSIRDIEYMFCSETRERIQAMLLGGLMRMQARVANDDGLEAADLVLMNEGEGLFEDDELQQMALRISKDADLEAREMARLCRVYLGRMMALRISSRDLPEPEL